MGSGHGGWGGGMPGTEGARDPVGDGQQWGRVALGEGTEKGPGCANGVVGSGQQEIESLASKEWSAGITGAGWRAIVEGHCGAVAGVASWNWAILVVDGEAT